MRTPMRISMMLTAPRCGQPSVFSWVSVPILQSKIPVESPGVSSLVRLSFQLYLYGSAFTSVLVSLFQNLRGYLPDPTRITKMVYQER